MPKFSTLPVSRARLQLPCAISETHNKIANMACGQRACTARKKHTNMFNYG